MDEYIIHGSTLRNLADQARLLTGENGTMSFSEIAEAFEDAAANGTGISGAHDEILYRKYGTDSSIIYVPPIATTLSSNYFPGSIVSDITSMSLPSCTGLGDVNILGCPVTPVTLELPAILSIPDNGCKNGSLGEVTMTSCTAIGEQSFSGCNHLETFRAPACVSVGEKAFYQCEDLTTVILNSACVIGADAFAGTLDPWYKTLCIYFVGNTIGSCSPDVLGENAGQVTYSCGAPDPLPSGAIPGIEIYVPSGLMASFQSSDWADGMFANNIHPLPAELP